MKKIVLYGDSIFNGFQADQSASPYNAFTSGQDTDLITKSVQKKCGQKAQVINLSQNGITVVEGLANLKRIPSDADLIILELGVNDSATWGISQHMFALDLEAIVRQLGPQRCIILGPSRPNPLNHKINIYFDENRLRINNEAARKIAQKYDIPFVNWLKAISSVEEPENYYQRDGLHFTPKGYQLLVDTMWPAIKEKLQA